MMNSINDIGSISVYKGDINGDNIIDSTDTALITAYLGSTPSSSSWLYPAPNTDYCGKDCDLNGDGIVNSTDLAIAQANLNQVGD